MARTPLSCAFAASANALSFRKTEFYGSVSRFCPVTTVKQPRGNRARIVALGAAPPPPPPSESGENPDQKETPELEIESDAQSERPAQSEQMEEVTADDILNSPSFLKKKLEIVQKELTEAQEAVEQSSDALKVEKAKYVRLAADFENYRRRSIEDLRKQESKSTAKVCKEILGVLDNFERAIAAVKAETDKEKSISSSYQAINKQLLDALTKLKVEPVDAIGEVFDPSLHEAIQKMESEDYKEDVVCQQFQRGYRLADVLIRPAIVAVSTGPGPAEENGKDGEPISFEDAEEIEQPV